MTALAGTPRLIRLALRRDRITLPVWVLSLAFFVGFTTALFDRSFVTEADVVRETQLVATNAGMRMLGLTSGPTVGGYMLHRDYVTLAVLAALMSTLAVVRHTRQNEELGRAEVLGSAVVGRYAGLAAAVVVAVLANVVLAGALALGTIIAGQPATGSFVVGLSVAAVGVVFVGVAAVTCQLASTTRGATGIASAVLGLAFALSGIGNMTGSVDEAGTRVTSAWPAWLSPIGWGQQMRPFADDLLWPLGLFAVLFAMLLVLAGVLNRRRDVARGLWPERQGRAHAHRGLLSPAGLAWRLQRGALAGWAVALTAFGLIFGSLTEQIQDVPASAAEWYQRAGGSAVIIDAYRTSIVGIAGMFVAVYVVQVLQRVRVDETGGTLEPLLAAAVTRRDWLLGHLANAALGAVVLILLFTIAMGWTADLVLADSDSQLGQLVVAGLVQLPGILVVAGLVVAIAAMSTRWSGPLSWVLLIGSMVLGPMFAPALDLPTWLQNLSPFTHTPKVPAAEVSATPVLLLVTTAAALIAAAYVTIKSRSLHLPA